MDIQTEASQLVRPMAINSFMEIRSQEMSKGIMIRMDNGWDIWMLTEIVVLLGESQHSVEFSLIGWVFPSGRGERE